MLQLVHSWTSTVTSNRLSRVRSWDPLTPLCNLGSETGPAHCSQADMSAYNISTVQWSMEPRQEIMQCTSNLRGHPSPGVRICNSSSMLNLLEKEHFLPHFWSKKVLGPLEPWVRYPTSPSYAWWRYAWLCSCSWCRYLILFLWKLSSPYVYLEIVSFTFQSLAWSRLIQWCYKYSLWVEEDLWTLCTCLSSLAWPWLIQWCYKYSLWVEKDLWHYAPASSRKSPAIFSWMQDPTVVLLATLSWTLALQSFPRAQEILPLFFLYTWTQLMFEKLLDVVLNHKLSERILH